MSIIGEPGIGKTRLVEELLGYVEELPELITWRRGRSLAYGEGVAFWALGEMVKAQAGVFESDTAQVAEAKLAEAVDGAYNGRAGSDWVVRHLRPLIGLEALGSASSESSQVEAFAAWRRFFEALAEDGPTVLVFEDIHWADDALLDFIDLLADRAGAVPLLIVCTARPELLRPTRALGRRLVASGYGHARYDSLGDGYDWIRRRRSTIAPRWATRNLWRSRDRGAPAKLPTSFSDDADASGTPARPGSSAAARLGRQRRRSSGLWEVPVTASTPTRSPSSSARP